MTEAGREDPSYLDIEPDRAADRPGFMPLADAAHWFASEGGAKRVAIDGPEWTEACRKVRDLISDANVSVRGVGKEKRQKVITDADVVFAGMPVVYFFNRMPLALKQRAYNEPPRQYLSICWAYEPAAWEGEFNDKVIQGDVQFDHLQVERAAVLASCPRAAPEAADNLEPATPNAASARGRKARHDWNKFDAHLFEVLDQEGVPDPKNDPTWTRAALVTMMLDWWTSPNGFGPDSEPPVNSTLFKAVESGIQAFTRMRETPEA